MGPDRRCVHTGPPGTGTMWSTYLPGTMWVHLRKGPSTDLDRSRSRVNGQDRFHYGSVSLSMLSQQTKCTCSSSFLQWPNLSINTLWPRLTCFSNLFLNILTFWRAFVLNNKMPFYKHCSNFRDLVNYPVPCKRSGYLEQFWTALVRTLRNGSNQIPKWTGPKFIRFRVNGDFDI